MYKQLRHLIDYCISHRKSLPSHRLQTLNRGKEFVYNCRWVPRKELLRIARTHYTELKVPVLSEKESLILSDGYRHSDPDLALPLIRRVDARAILINSNHKLRKKAKVIAEGILYHQLIKALLTGASFIDIGICELSHIGRMQVVREFCKYGYYQKDLDLPYYCACFNNNHETIFALFTTKDIYKPKLIPREALVIAILCNRYELINEFKDQLSVVLNGEYAELFKRLRNRCTKFIANITSN